VNEHSGISETVYSSDSEINVKISSCGEQSVNSDDEENVSGNSNIQHDMWAKSGADWPRFPFIGKTGINVDLEDPNNPWNILSCTPEIAEIIARETNRYAHKFLENTLDLKRRSRIRD
jgi:hypothetical protein